MKLASVSRAGIRQGLQNERLEQVQLFSKGIIHVRFTGEQAVCITSGRNKIIPASASCPRLQGRGVGCKEHEKMKQHPGLQTGGGDALCRENAGSAGARSTHL